MLSQTWSLKWLAAKKNQIIYECKGTRGYFTANWLQAACPVHRSVPWPVAQRPVRCFPPSSLSQSDLAIRRRISPSSFFSLSPRPHKCIQIKLLPIADWECSQELITNNDGSTAFFTLWFHKFVMSVIRFDFPFPISETTAFPRRGGERRGWRRQTDGMATGLRNTNQTHQAFDLPLTARESFRWYLSWLCQIGQGVYIRSSH